MAAELADGAFGALCSSRSRAFRIRHLAACNRGNIVQLPAALHSPGAGGCCRLGEFGCWDGTGLLWSRRVPGQLTRVSRPGSPSQHAACSASSTACPETLPGMAGAVREVVFPLWYVSASSISALIALHMQKVGRGTETTESQS